MCNKCQIERQLSTPSNKVTQNKPVQNQQVSGRQKQVRIEDCDDEYFMENARPSKDSL